MIKPNPKISIVILNWNRRNFLKQAIESVLNQDYKNYEIIVADNNSTDGSSEMIEENFKDIKLLKFKENLGIEARNIAFSILTGDIIFSLDNDAKLGKNALSKIVKEFEKNPKLGLVQCNILTFDSKNISNWFHALPREKYFKKEFYTSCFGAGCSAIKSEVLKKTGNYNPHFFSRGEELDLAYKILDNKYLMKYCPKIIVYHAICQENRSNSKNYYLDQRNIIWAFWLNLPFPEVIIKTCRFLIGTLFRIRLNFMFSYFKAIFHAFLGLPWVIKERKPIKHSTLKLIKRINSTEKA
ncbi:glycosyltransferase family 2 protein [Candidatus Woesearchaeota archaeon]|nr:hypothetical protein [uncultured archaeon]MBS3167304.1 glycosyltransferase family 2 protein [Candidatus Woesearchaeota archaeon]